MAAITVGPFLAAIERTPRRRPRPGSWYPPLLLASLLARAAAWGSLLTGSTVAQRYLLSGVCLTEDVALLAVAVAGRSRTLTVLALASLTARAIPPALRLSGSGPPQLAVGIAVLLVCLAVDCHVSARLIRLSVLARRRR